MEKFARLRCRKSLCLCASVVGSMYSDVLRSRVIVYIKGVQSFLSGNTLLCTANYEVMATQLTHALGCGAQTESVARSRNGSWCVASTTLLSLKDQAPYGLWPPSLAVCSFGAVVSRPFWRHLRTLDVLVPMFPQTLGALSSVHARVFPAFERPVSTVTQRRPKSQKRVHGT